MQIIDIPFGEWLPDQPDYKNPGCLTANNCFPTGGGYSPFPGRNDQGDVIDEPVRGAKQYFRSDGTSVIVGGTDTKLFVVVNGTLTETTGYTSIGDTGYWQFAQFNSLIIAVSPTNTPQYLADIETDTSWVVLPGSPPTASAVGRVGYFLMLGNISGSPSRVQWSAENDPTAAWVTDRTAQSGLAELQPEYGEITGFAGDRYPMVFQQRGIFRVQPAGPPTVFDVAQAVSEERGCIAPGSIVTKGFETYFLSHDGFYVTNGNEVAPIGSQRVNEFFFQDVSETDRFRTQGTIVWEQQCVIWSYYPASNATGYKRQMIYSWQENRWSTASLEADYIVDNKVGATTLEGLDALFATLEDVTPSMDSSFWLARSRVLSAFVQDGSGNSELSLLNGAVLEACFETADAQPKTGHRTGVNAIYPRIENSSQNTTAALITREYKGGTAMTGDYSSINQAGFCPVRGDGRFVRAKVVVPAAANWDKAQGAAVEFRVSGKR